MDWWDFLDLMNEEFSKMPPKQVYFDFQDEIRMRLIESVSEGASFKYSTQAKKVHAAFSERLKQEPAFATAEDYQEFTTLTEQI